MAVAVHPVGQVSPLMTGHLVLNGNHCPHSLVMSGSITSVGWTVRGIAESDLAFLMAGSSLFFALTVAVQWLSHAFMLSGMLSASKVPLSEYPKMPSSSSSLATMTNPCCLPTLKTKSAVSPFSVVVEYAICMSSDFMCRLSLANCCALILALFLVMGVAVTLAESSSMKNRK